jgi:hypothetical protein
LPTILCHNVVEDFILSVGSRRFSARRGYKRRISVNSGRRPGAGPARVPEVPFGCALQGKEPIRRGGAGRITATRRHAPLPQVTGLRADDLQRGRHRIQCQPDTDRVPAGLRPRMDCRATWRYRRHCASSQPAPPARPAMVQTITRSSTQHTSHSRNSHPVMLNVGTARTGRSGTYRGA